MSRRSVTLLLIVATHDALAVRHSSPTVAVKGVASLAADDAKQIVKPCDEACSKAGSWGTDSSCRVQCQAEMYACHDHNHTVATDEFQECHNKVVAKYEAFEGPTVQFLRGSQASKKSTAVAVKQIVKPCADACAKAGEPGDESSCYTMCEAEMFQCHDHNHTVATAEFQACHDAVVAKYEAHTGKLFNVGSLQIVQPCADACVVAGEPGDDSSCYTMCEADMYMCHDYNHTVEKDDFKACEEKVVNKYKGYGTDHSAFFGSKQIVKPCAEACAKAGPPGDESSCYTMCESEMFQCHDHNHTVAKEDFQKCQDAVAATYAAYHGDKAALLAKRQVVRPCADACARAGEPGDESSCYTTCEAEMFQCHDHNHTVATAECQACHDAVVAKYEAYHADPALLLAKKEPCDIVTPCADACHKAGASDDSDCVTMCEAEMYQCHDHNQTVAVEEFQACHNTVIAKYEAYDPSKALFFASRRGIFKPCLENCKMAGESGSDSVCYTSCESEMYQCNDFNKTTEAVGYKACEHRVMAKYQSYNNDTSALLLTTVRLRFVKICAHYCAAAGEPGLDSNCYTNCETDMYHCLDHNRTVAPLDYMACEHRVRAKFKSYEKPVGEQLLLAASRQIVEPCKDACAKAGASGDESSCHTMCEAEMFQCHDHNHTVATAEFQACHDGVVTKYEAFHVGSTAFLLSKRQIVKPCAEACAKAGEPGEESSCYSMCETDMFQCHDHNHTVATAEFQGCSDKVVAKYESFHH